MSVWIVVVAAGSGSRFGGPKQYELLGSSRVVDRSIATSCRVADRVALVVAAGDVEDSTLPHILLSVLSPEAYQVGTVRGGRGAVSRAESRGARRGAPLATRYSSSNRRLAGEEPRRRGRGERFVRGSMVGRTGERCAVQTLGISGRMCGKPIETS